MGFSIQGLDKLESVIGARMAQRSKVLENLAPALEAGVPAFSAVEAQHYDSGGSGKWAGIKPITLEYKAQLGVSGPPLVRTQTLRSSIVGPTVFSAGPTRIEFGTAVRYAKYHQRGFTMVWRFRRDSNGRIYRILDRSISHGVPARKIVDLSGADRQQIARAVTAVIRSQLAI